MSADWGYGFRVSTDQDRNTRYTDATVNNASITEQVQEDADQARDIAFLAIDQMGIEKPYEVYANGSRDVDGGRYSLTASVQPG